MVVIGSLVALVKFEVLRHSRLAGLVRFTELAQLMPYFLVKMSFFFNMRKQAGPLANILARATGISAKGSAYLLI